MKTLQQCLNESVQDNLLKKLQDTWDRTQKRFPMDMSEMIEFAKKALESAKVKPGRVQDELGTYEDPDDMADAMERGEFTNTNRFIDEFAQVLSVSEYGGKEGDYADGVAENPNFLYDLMDYIDRFEK